MTDDSGRAAAAVPAELCPQDPAQIWLNALRTGAGVDIDPVVHVRSFPARAGTPAPWPLWVPSDVRTAFSRRGVALPWAHQAQAAELAWSGFDVVVATGTASGKSLAYQLPALSAVAADDRTRVLYLSPTKALGTDQLRGLEELGAPNVRASMYDGDTPADQRDWARTHGNWLLSNPDMVHRSVLSQHRRWASFLRRLRYVVIDECHTYRGLFGAQVAHVLRRLRRVCAVYGADPVFVLASATAADPAAAAERLIGRPVRPVSTDTSPAGAKTFALWEPPLTALRTEHDAPRRRSAGTETAGIVADLVMAGAHTLAFARSRRGAELVALGAQRHLAEAGLEALGRRVATYRGGFLPAERRALEAKLNRGELLAVAATNALELGIDIAGLDAVVLAGYPGSMASLWQQSGRAGRAQQSSLVVFVARDDPLDTYLVHHPDALFDHPLESTVFDPLNPYVLAPQLCCAAAEKPITGAELALFGGDAVRPVLDALVEAGLLRHRSAGWFWTDASAPVVDLRGSGGEAVTIVEVSTGSLLGTVDPGAAHSTVHAGAVYLHQGESYVVDSLDLRDRAALVHLERSDWTTCAQEITDISVVSVLARRAAGSVGVYFGDVRVAHQVVGYQRRWIKSGELIDETPLDLPPRVLDTRAVWYTVDDDAVADAGIDREDLSGAVHAAEHAAIALLPLFATCDRWDIGGVSTAVHVDTGRATVFVYDGYPGGAGFAERGHAVLSAWLAATRAAIAACECIDGCPSCVQSPKCGSGNYPLDKAGALRWLDVVLTELSAASDSPELPVMAAA